MLCFPRGSLLILHASTQVSCPLWALFSCPKDLGSPPPLNCSKLCYSPKGVASNGVFTHLPPCIKLWVLWRRQTCLSYCFKLRPSTLHMFCQHHRINGGMNRGVNSPVVAKASFCGEMTLHVNFPVWNWKSEWKSGRFFLNNIPNRKPRNYAIAAQFV